MGGGTHQVGATTSGAVLHHDPQVGALEPRAMVPVEEAQNKRKDR